MRKIHVLVVEDDADLREAIVDTLEVSGINVEGVGDGESAIAWLNKSECELIISDVNMPGMDGYQLCARL